MSFIETQAGYMRGVRAMLHDFADATDPNRRQFCDGQAFQLASAICRGVRIEASTEGHQTYPESHELPKLYTGLYMYKKINQYYIVQAAIADTI